MRVMRQFNSWEAGGVRIDGAGKKFDGREDCKTADNFAESFREGRSIRNNRQKGGGKGGGKKGGGGDQDPLYSRLSRRKKSDTTGQTHLAPAKRVDITFPNKKRPRTVRRQKEKEDARPDQGE